MANRGRGFLTKGQRQACAQLVKSGVFPNKRACGRNIRKHGGRIARAEGPKIRSCSPSDRGIKAIQSYLVRTRAAIYNHGHRDPGRAEMWANDLETYRQVLVKRCGRRRGDRLYIYSGRL